MRSAPSWRAAVGEDASAFHKLNKAYNVLNDETLRAVCCFVSSLCLYEYVYAKKGYSKNIEWKLVTAYRDL